MAAMIGGALAGFVRQGCVDPAGQAARSPGPGPTNAGRLGAGFVSGRWPAAGVAVRRPGLPRSMRRARPAGWPPAAPPPGPRPPAKCPSQALLQRGRGQWIVGATQHHGVHVGRAQPGGEVVQPGQQVAVILPGRFDRLGQPGAGQAQQRHALRVGLHQVLQALAAQRAWGGQQGHTGIAAAGHSRLDARLDADKVLLRPACPQAGDGLGGGGVAGHHHQICAIAQQRGTQLGAALGHPGGRAFAPGRVARVGDAAQARPR